MMCVSSSREVWKDVNDRFGQSNGSRYIYVQREINSTLQGTSNIAT